MEEWVGLSVDSCTHQKGLQLVKSSWMMRERGNFTFSRRTSKELNISRNTRRKVSFVSDPKEESERGRTASLTASETVGWAWQVRATSSADAPYSNAKVASPINSPATDEIYITQSSHYVSRETEWVEGERITNVRCDIRELYQLRLRSKPWRILLCRCWS